MQVDRASDHIKNQNHANSYYEKKAGCFVEIAGLLERERTAIESSNTEELDFVLHGIEMKQVEIDGLDREYSRSSDSLTAQESKSLEKMMVAIIKVSKRNEQLLRQQRHTVLFELRAIRTKKSARNAYKAAGLRDQISQQGSWGHAR